MSQQIANPQIVTNGLVVYLDAANIRSYTSGSTTWRDLSGNNITGSINNSPGFISDGGSSFSLNGTNQWFNLGKPPQLNFGTGSFTVSIWFKPTVGNQLKFLASKGATGLDNGWWLAIDNRYNGILNGIGFSAQSSATNGNNGAKGATTPYTVGEWNYIVGMWDSVNKDIYIYINGTRRNTTIVQSTGAGLSGVTTTDQLDDDTTIAAYDNGASFYLQGNVSSVLMYNRLLSDTEVAQNYNALKLRFNLP